MILNMRDDQLVDKIHPPTSTRSIIHTTGTIVTRNGSPKQMKSAKGRIIHLIGNPHLATLPNLQHPNNLPPL